jgi:meiotically up-regulated gene 157 (Mug157) protein
MGTGLMLAPSLEAFGQGRFESKRPALADRRFTSDAVEATIQAAKPQIADAEVAWMFENCFPNTLDTTVQYREVGGKPDTFVITGDIDAMWLRDSSAQVWPYLPLASKDEKLRRLLEGVIRRQAQCILIDPYANSFLPDPTQSRRTGDRTDMKPGVFERKWEVDSLCYPIRLAHGYWKQTGDTRPFDADWEAAMDRVLQTFREQQRKDGPGPYHFQRGTDSPTETQFFGGYGWPRRCSGPRTMRRSSRS